MFKSVNRSDHYEIVDATTNEVVETVADNTAAYFRTHELNVAEWKQAERHNTYTSTRKLGGSPIRGGGTFRCSEAHCSCGWSSTDNGQTYQESMQLIREHLKEVGVYNTPTEQKVYAHLDTPRSPGEISLVARVTIGRVKNALASLETRGYVAATEALYERTPKWFSWND